MAAEKFLQLNNGVPTGKSAVQTSTGVSEAGRIVALDDQGKLDPSVMPVGVGAETDTATTSEAIAAGDFVNLYASSGLKARKADASAVGKEATHFALAAIANGATGTFYRISQLNNQRTGMTPGAKQYLSTSTPGGTQETIPSVSGQVVQVLGIARSATELIFQPSTPVVV